MKKKTMNLPTGMDVVPAVVGAGVSLGVGASMLGQMGQGAVADKVITPAAGMLGTMATVGMGMGVLKMASDMSSASTSKKKKSFF